jgi:hypothetical protein
MSPIGPLLASSTRNVAICGATTDTDRPDLRATTRASRLNHQDPERISYVSVILSVATRDRDSRHRAVCDVADAQVAVVVG